MLKNRFLYSSRYFGLFSLFLIILIADARLIRFDAFPDGLTAIYNRSAIFYNYFDAGFFRRGLSGTVLHLMGDSSRLSSLLYFHIASAIWLAIPSALLLKSVFIKRGGAIASFYLFALVATPFAFRGWAADIGRADMLAFGFVAWSVLALLKNRPYIAAILIPIGALSHESAAIMGAPLLIALGFAAYQKNRESGRRLLSAALIMIIFVFVVYFAGNYATNPQKMLASATVFYS